VTEKNDNEEKKGNREGNKDDQYDASQGNIQGSQVSDNAAITGKIGAGGEGGSGGQGGGSQGGGSQGNQRGG
jgi:single-strand DNA-binding protein